MIKLKHNNYFFNNNEISISLMRYHVMIKILNNGDFIYYQTIISQDLKQIIFNFYTIEAALNFVDNVVPSCINNDEIIDNYHKMFENNEFSSPKILKKNNKY